MKTIVLVLLLVLAGCAAKTVMLKNDAGQVARCHYSGDEHFWKGGRWAENDLQSCVKDYEAEGFKQLTAKEGG